MKLKEIISFINERIPEDLALKHDNVGLNGEYDLNQEITSIKIFMDLLPDDDNGENTLIITHHPPLFIPKTPTYTIHSNWDVIKGGSNDILAKTLKLDVIDVLDEKTNIGRICKTDYSFNQLKKIILDKYENVRIVTQLNDDYILNKIGIISGFGLKNSKYVKLAKEKELDILISGDLTQETAILGKNLSITLIDLGHHESEVPGLYQLANLLKEININIEVIDKTPIKVIK